MGYPTSTSRPSNATASRKCRTCNRIVFWWVGAGDGYSNLVKHPRFGKITRTGYYCQDHATPGPFHADGSVVSTP